MATKEMDKNAPKYTQQYYNWISAEYEKLWNEFMSKWHFSLGGGVGTYIIYLSNSRLVLAYRKLDKRYSDNYKFDIKLKTESVEEMRKYLTENEPR